ncbi:acyl-CoA thioesterase [Sediminibacterium soli]|uniref:acyl-CoA thioesterase n=1 Tax=Sediminibacterium soli TaxID=2698829 RepID=UPI00137A15C4|nr:thioesterase family protein [Sediminibacterium soli]NCI47924.1 acyl-CoA thioesterase [Sediminibacterium soli]
MNRIKIELPGIFHFSTLITIRITDLNYGGHVGNDSFLSLIHEARQQFLRAHGYEELSLGGVGLIMADVAIEFKRELNYADTIRISVAADGFDKLGFDLYYLLEYVNETETVIAGKAKTGMLCFDYTTGKKMVTPEAVIRKLGGPPDA